MFRCHKRYKSSDVSDLSTKEIEYVARMNEISVYTEGGSKKKASRGELCQRLSTANIIWYDEHDETKKIAPRIARRPDYIIFPVGRFIETPLVPTLWPVEIGIYGFHVYYESFE